MTALDDLRALDEKIAWLRGWIRRKRTSGILIPGDAWIAPDAAEARAMRCGLIECNGVNVTGYIGTQPPPFSSEWALAGPLLTEANIELDPFGIGGWRANYYRLNDDGEDEHGESFSCPEPTECIARAWLAWRKSQPRA